MKNSAFSQAADLIQDYIIEVIKERFDVELDRMEISILKLEEDKMLRVSISLFEETGNNQRLVDFLDGLIKGINVGEPSLQRIQETMKNLRGDNQ